MRRRRSSHEEEHVNHERWLVSYADFITLMFAFFVVMYSYAQSDGHKAAMVSEAIEQSLKEDSFTTRVLQVLHLQKDEKKPTEEASNRQSGRMSELNTSLKELNQTLKSEIERGMVRVSMQARGLVISLNQSAFFPTGDATVDPRLYAAVEKVAQTLRKIPNPVRLEGHTDSIPISTDRFRSNWHLSAARSIAMLDLMTDHFGIARQRLAAVGYADTVPIDTNDTEEGRARNRRVDITILNEASIQTEARSSR